MLVINQTWVFLQSTCRKTMHEEKKHPDEPEVAWLTGCKCSQLLWFGHSPELFGPIPSCTKRIRTNYSISALQKCFPRKAVKSKPDWSLGGLTYSPHRCLICTMENHRFFMASAFNTRLTDNYSEGPNCGETPSGSGNIRAGAHTLGYRTESNGPTPGNGFSFVVWVRVLGGIHASSYQVYLM